MKHILWVVITESSIYFHNMPILSLVTRAWFWIDLLFCVVDAQSNKYSWNIKFWSVMVEKRVFCRVCLQQSIYYIRIRDSSLQYYLVRYIWVCERYKNKMNIACTSNHIWSLKYSVTKNLIWQQKINEMRIIRASKIIFVFLCSKSSYFA